MKNITSKITLTVITLVFIAVGAYGVSVWKDTLVEKAECCAVGDTGGLNNESAEAARARGNLGRVAFADCHR